MAGAALLVAVLLCAVHSAFALSNGLGKTPPMGWNSWNHFNCNVNETLLRETADAFVKKGLSAVGYQYINVDDCWQVERDAKGFIKEDAKAFPSGMKALADYIHSQGLKFGVYSDAGYKTCAGRPGSLNFEAQDAQTYASWGVDYLKYDNCNPDSSSPKKRYPKMRDALAAVSRPIFFSMCEWGVEDPATWAKEVGNSWRTTGDISDNWGSFLGILEANNKWWKYAGPGGWNDPDMLEVGNGGMTEAEYRAHFSLWALMKAPLLIGCDVRSIPDATLSILNNTEVIAVNQDALGVQGHKIVSSAGKDVWAGPLADGSVAVVLFNRNQQPASITAQWQDIGLVVTQTATVRDLWKHADVGTAVGSFSANVEAHSVVMLRITPVHSLSLSN